MDQIAGFVLAGGRSTRMGTDKALLDWRGRPLIEHALKLLRCVAPEVRIVGPQAQFERFGPVIEDRYCGCGPLAGIHAALSSSAIELNLVLAVDMPFVTPEFLCYVVEQARGSSAAVTVPRIGGKWQPLCAVFRRSFGPIAEASLSAGKNKIDALFSAVELRVIDEYELQRLSVDERMFENLNTREQWKLAQDGQVCT